MRADLFREYPELIDAAIAGRAQLGENAAECVTIGGRLGRAAHVEWGVRSRLASTALALIACTPAPPAAPTGRHFHPSRTYECHHLVDGKRDASEIRRLETSCARANREAAREDCECTQLGLALAWGTADERRHGSDVLVAACEHGSTEACDFTELNREVCLHQPDDPSCDALRAVRVIPTESLPLEQVLGCFRMDAEVLCLQRAEYDLRDAKGAWDVGPISKWQRDDGIDMQGWGAVLVPRWSAEVPDGRFLVGRGRLIELPCSHEGAALRNVDPNGAPPCARKTSARLVPLGAAELRTVSQEIASATSRARSCNGDALACWKAAEASLGAKLAPDATPTIQPPEPTMSLATCTGYISSVVEQLRSSRGPPFPEACRVP